MRVTTNSFTTDLRHNISVLAERQLRLQQQVSTGQRITSASDDPNAMRRVLDLRNEQGQLIVSAYLGAVVGQKSGIAVGAGVGYAVFGGVVPGVRGVVIASDGIGGEVAATLTLSAPFDFYLIPFLIGEVGGRFDPIGQGLLYGGGGGVYIGNPNSTFGLQLGWMFRRIDYGDIGSADASGPIISLSLRF